MAFLYLNNTPYIPQHCKATLDYAAIEGERFVCIRNVDQMPAFFMSLASDSDVWLFVGSNGVFTAGRRDPDHGLFPYQTVDKVMSHPDACGARTTLVVDRTSRCLWEPWHDSGRVYAIERNLYKHVCGTSVVFEEINHDLGMSYRTFLSACERYGVVRRSTLRNTGDCPARIDALDGWLHLITPGVSQELYAQFSCLASAYMHHELHPGENLGVYTLNSRLSDRPEPAECLRAACAWSVGLERPTILLSTRQVDAFKLTGCVEPEYEVRGEFGAYLAASSFDLKPGQSVDWWTVADTDMDHPALLRLRKELATPRELAPKLQHAIAHNTFGLRAKVAAADGLQTTATPCIGVHHFANVLYNCMRGGTLESSGHAPVADFALFLRQRNRPLAERHSDWVARLGDTLPLARLRAESATVGDPQLARLAREYLPLTFSRRHGDPSRPWNRFCIRVRDEAGNPIHSYQGNWRDIFQNWEALAVSFPDALENMIAVFLNASTADGYNPYRVTREGIDWEVTEPGNPWSNIGYWGDHQIVYLFRLLDKLERFQPRRLSAILAKPAFATAHVPYRIADFADIVATPRATITFDGELHRRLTARAEQIGADAKLVGGADGNPHLVSLAEKLIVPAAVKLSNLVPGGGIWMNTQRPEWNDANNALAGWGLSVVTTCYLRRYLAFCRELFAASRAETVPLSDHVAQFVADLARILPRVAGADPDATRRCVIEALGMAGERHRHTAYTDPARPLVDVPVADILGWLDSAIEAITSTIVANRRANGLFHSYNTLAFPASGEAAVGRLDLMLEGQVAALSCGLLPPAEVVRVLGAMATSPLYRADQQSFLLYPDRQVCSFLDRNVLPADAVSRAPLLGRLLGLGDMSLVVSDDDGALHFQGDLTNAQDVERALTELGSVPDLRADVERDRPGVLELWEGVFNHRAFTGRSGTMFGYEGLGSIYWHMVAKLLLAVQESFQAADAAEADAETLEALAAAYRRVRDGLGFRKTPTEWGAFPTDPYSHTPAHRGAQQPGMTGQVKEEILTRFGELGVSVEDGCLLFRPRLVDRAEFASTPLTFEYVSTSGKEQAWELPTGSLGFTFCQVPVCYRLGSVLRITIERADGRCDETEGDQLSREDSVAIFERTGRIDRITVTVPAASLIGNS